LILLLKFFGADKELFVKVNISALGLHSSFPATFLANSSKLELLAQRADLYQSENFYCGFDSSNHNFLDIIEQQEPLAIKYENTFSIYHYTSTKTTYDLYFIEEKSKKLLPLIKLEVQAVDRGLLDYIIPFEFVDLYERVYQKNDSDEAFSDMEKVIALFLKKIVDGEYPTENESAHFQRALNELEKETTCKVRVENLSSMH
jgi:hypothetical protein